MPGVVNFTGGSARPVYSARQHPEKSAQKRFFAQHRFGPELNRLERERKKEKMQDFDFGWTLGAASQAPEQVNSSKSKRQTPSVGNNTAHAPHKKARKSAILQALDDDPIVSFDLHRQRLLAEDDWAGLKITLDGLASTEGRTYFEKPLPSTKLKQPAHSSRQNDMRLPLQSYSPQSSFAGIEDCFARGAYSPANEVDAGLPDDAPLPRESSPKPRASVVARTFRPDSAQAASDLAFNGLNLERLPTGKLATLPAHKTHSDRPTLDDNPRSIFSVRTSVASSRASAPSSDGPPSSTSGAPRSSPSSTHSSRSDRTHTSTGSSRRGKLSITDRILSGQETLHASLATIILDRPTEKDVARRKVDTNGDTLASDETTHHDGPLPKLQNPFVYLSAALKLKNLVGSSSEE